ncbi:MAG: hypothetical protein WC390_12540 [Sulfurimonas sp.]
MTPNIHAASPGASEAIARAGQAIASLRTWRLIIAEGGQPSNVDGELRAPGCFKLVDARSELRRALAEVEALIEAHPDVIGEVSR